MKWSDFASDRSLDLSDITESNPHRLLIFSPPCPPTVIYSLSP